ncbi:MAG TPA: lipoyl(octanoyl) transferase LipB [Polyangia bacterium]|nr:lipoyl(octanoyl) transferase LipB [Polyangia bacterium]
MTPLAAVWLGRVGYAAAVELQERLRRRILDGDRGAETLLLVEHDAVITLGRGARAEHVLASPSELRARGVAVERSSRGGDVTYHGPGQLVAYPVMRLERGVVAHVEAMAAACIDVAASLGVRARFRRECPGVWVGDDKLAAFGVHVHRRVAAHGVALNVSTALDAFDLIVPCGLKNTRATSLAALTGRALAPADLAPPFADAFARAAGRAIPPLLSRSLPVE